MEPNRATRTKELDSYKSDDGALGSDGKGEKEKIATRPVDKDQLQVLPQMLGTTYCWKQRLP